LKRANILNKIISMVMVLAIMLSFAAPASAAVAQLSSGSIGYLAMGDDMTNGVGLEWVTDENGQPWYVPAYPALVAQYLYGEENWEDAYSLRAGTGYRMEELRYLIDDDYNGDGYTAKFGTNTATGIWGLKKPGTVKNEVRSADYISIGVGVNNFATYIVEQILYYVENDGAVKYAYSFDEFASAEVEEAFQNMKTVVMSELLAAAPDKMDGALELIEYVAEVSAYAYLSYGVSFNALVEEIYALNPDVKLFVLGIYNPAEGEVLTLDVEGRHLELEIGKYFNALIEMANVYTQILSPRKYDYTYVDPGAPELLIDVMGNTALSTEDRVPTELKKRLIDMVDDTVADMIQEMFAQYGVEKTYDEALDIAYEIFYAETEGDRKEVIYDQINDLAIDEVLARFQEELENSSSYGEKITITREEVLQLLNDLGAEGADKNAVATTFIVDKMAESMVGMTFAGIYIGSKQDAFDAIDLLERNSQGDPDAMKEAAADMVMDKVLEEDPNNTLGLDRDDVIDLLDRLDGKTTSDDRRAEIKLWLNERTAEKIAAKVSAYIPGYTVTDAAGLLVLMEASNTDDDAAIAKAHLQEKFRPVMADAIREKYEDGGFTLQNYNSFEEFVDTINAQPDSDAVRVIVRNEVRDAATEAIYAHVTDDSNGMPLLSVCKCTNHPENNCTGINRTMIYQVLVDIEAAAEGQKDAVLHQWLVANFFGGVEPTGAAKEYIFNPIENTFKTNIASYEAAAKTAEDKFAEYYDTVNEASDAFGQYVELKGQAAETILQKYEESYKGAGETAQGYYKDYCNLRDAAVEKVLKGYDEYQSAIQKGLDSCDQLDETFDKVYDLLCEISEVEKISLNDLLDVANKVKDSGGSYITTMVENLVQGDDMAKEDKTVAYLALRYYLADSMMIMPSAKGHLTIANQMIKGVKGEPTYSTGGYYANKVIDKAIDIYHCAQAWLDLSTTESGQLDPLVNPDVYVAFGDNVTTGSALDDASVAYPQLIGGALAMDENDRDGGDHVYNYAINGMRVEELLMLVDESYNGDAYTADRFGTDYIESLRAEYKQNIANADLITINAGINNLTTYPMTQTLLAYNGETPYEMDWGRFIGESRADKIEAGKDVVMDLLLGIVDSAENRVPKLDDISAYERCERALKTASTAVESMLYGLVSYVFTLDDAVEKIAEASPNATIALVGFYNPLEGTHFTVDRTVTVRGKTVDLSQYPINVSAMGDLVLNQANRFLAHYVGNIRTDGTAADPGSRLLNVDISDTHLFVTDDDTVSKDLSTLVDYKDFTLRGHTITIKVPEYLLRAAKTTGDALHPNAAGHEYIADQILTALDFDIYADVIVDNYTKVYGDPDPDFEHLLDDLSTLYGIEVTGVTRVAGENVGEYQLSVVYSAEAGYKEIDEEFGTLTITQRTATVNVTVKDGQVTNVAYNNVLDADKETLANGLKVDPNTNAVTCENETINKNYILTINVTVEEDEPVIGKINFEGVTLVLDGVVYMNYYMSFEGFADDVDFAKDGGFLIWKGDEAPTKASQMVVENTAECQNIPGLEQGKHGWYAQTNEVYAKNLGDLIYMRPYVEIAEGVYVYGPAKVGSPETYCRNQFNRTDVTQATKEVCAALLAYGAAAQNYFDEETDNLVTEGLDLSKYNLTFDENMLDPLKELTMEKDGEKLATLDGARNKGITTVGATLLLEGAIIMRVGYNMPADIDMDQVAKAEVLFWTEDDYAAADTLAYSAGTYSYKGDLVWGALDGTPCYVAESDYVVAKALGETFYFSLRVEMEDGTIHRGGINWYSPEKYASNKLGTTNPELLELVQAIAVYSEKARICFGN